MAGFRNDQVFGETLRLTRTSSGQWQFLNVCTDLVRYDEEGNPLTIKYDFIHILILNEIKKIKKQLEEINKVCL